MQEILESATDLLHKERLNHLEKIKTRDFEESEDGSLYIAKQIAQQIQSNNSLRKNTVLGLATGSSPVKVYEYLVKMHQEEGLTFQSVITFNLDEYFPIEKTHKQSYVRFMNEHLFDHIDINKENVHIPDGELEPSEIQAFCESYEDMIESAGGLDIQILGIGRTGHIGFNEPGSAISSKTRLIRLDKKTRIDAASDFYGEENVPPLAITMGIDTIMKARKVFIMAWGEGKAGIAKEAIEGKISSTVPATYLQQHPDVEFILDAGSASDLTRVHTPWQVGNCDWNDQKLVKRAVVWLADKLNKVILKLTNEDYNENGMSELIAHFGSAEDINLKVFNNLQNTITGWPGGKPNADDSTRPERADPFPKRSIIFSPHPDDDVISMGATLLRLVDQGHEVHVAYQTSGNIAVFEDDVLRHIEFVNGMIDADSKSELAMLVHDLKEELLHRGSDYIPSRRVIELKGLIRRTEALAGCRYCGVSEEQAHFLNLPFYETGEIQKGHITEKDIQITYDLLQKIKPTQIYAAGDLSDPHGTHRVCLKVIYATLERLKEEGADWLKDCYVWLYRGAWQEWDITDIEMAVPIGPKDMARKKKAIFKHQSQKDTAMFPGSDKREFWQRAEDRNRDTALKYNKLGFAEYEAMEAFVRKHF